MPKQHQTMTPKHIVLLATVIGGVVLLAVGAYLIVFDGVTGDNETDCTTKQLNTTCCKTDPCSTASTGALSKGKRCVRWYGDEGKCRKGTCQPGETTDDDKCIPDGMVPGMITAAAGVLALIVAVIVALVWRPKKLA